MVDNAERIVLGLDASLTHTGIAVLSVSGKYIKGATCTPKEKGVIRLVGIRAWLQDVLATYPDITLAVMEGYAFTPVHGQAFSLGELGGVIKLLLHENNVTLLTVAPQTLKKWVTGEGKGDKNMMLLKAFRKWGIEFCNDHECDAYGLAQIGMSICNIDVKTMKQYLEYEQEVLKLILKQLKSKEGD